MIYLSQSEVELLLKALKHTQEFQREDSIADEDSPHPFRNGTEQWMNRSRAAEALISKLQEAS